MKAKMFLRWLSVGLASALVLILLPSGISAHCDTMNGPVVTAAKKALESGDVNLVLIWVQKNDEAEIRATFDKTVAVRKLGPEAKNLADRHFFETLIRIHRAGEGVPFAGLKPASTPIDPGIDLAEEALDSGSAEQLLKQLNKIVDQAIHKKLTDVLAKRKFKADDVEARRQYVKSYVEFIHYVERLYESAAQPSEGHHRESESGVNHEVH